LIPGGEQCSPHFTFLITCSLPCVREAAIAGGIGRTSHAVASKHHYGLPELMFEVDGGHKPARDLCARYVELLGALVADFKRRFP
jgi:hypothetical protein